MHIKRLYIGDFGILRNQTLDPLLPGLVIVGGCNRAGKSTFMKVLKYLGYGFPKSGLPPANVRYQAEADVIRDEHNELIHIRLDGHSEPVCTLPRERGFAGVPIREIYPVDAFTYQNLFVISLDQLARIPEGLDKKEALQLHSVLLGAGLSDLAEIPQLESKFMKAAMAIGGQRGSKTVKGFSPYIRLIEDGISKRKQALAQVEEYRLQQEKLAELEQRLGTLQKDLKLQQADYSVLELLKSSYDVLEEVSQAAAVLEQHEGKAVTADFPLQNEHSVRAGYERYKELESKWQEQYDRLRNSLENKESIEKLIPLILKYRAVLESFHNRLSGLKERWNQLNGLREKAKEEQKSLLIRMKRLNPSWTEQDIQRIKDLPLELPDEKKLADAIARYRQVLDQIQQLEYRKEDILSEAERLKQQKAEWQMPALGANLKIYLWASVISAILGIAMFSLHRAAGLFLGLFGIVGSALFVFMKSLGQKEAGIKQRELDSAIAGYAGQAEGIEKRIQQHRQEQDALEEYLSSARAQLDMEEFSAPDSILEYYRALVDVQEKITRLQFDRSEADELSRSLDQEIAELKKVLNELEKCRGDISTGDGQGRHTPGSQAGTDDSQSIRNLYNIDSLQNIDSWHFLQSRLLKWYDRLQAAIQLENLSSEKGSTAKKLIQLLQLPNQPEQHSSEMTHASADALDEMVGTYLSLCRSRKEFLTLQQRTETLLQGLSRATAADRLKNAVSLLKAYHCENMEDHAGSDDEKHGLDYFFERYHAYPTQDALEKEFLKASSGMKQLEEQIERCKEEIQKARSNLDRLALTTELEQAHEMIRKGRAGLYPAARQYAVNKAAAWLCRDIRNRFMDTMRDELLKNADGILRELTEGEYQKITPDDDLTNPDFSFTLSDGSIQDGADILSRGTKEQVFLAVRLGRIMDIKPSLPVIIDDSFVNYDPSHLKQAVSVISKLSSTRQIFLMTCHPHLIRLIEETGVACQYWQLENGQFSVSDGGALIQHLQERTREKAYN